MRYLSPKIRLWAFIVLAVALLTGCSQKTTTLHTPTLTAEARVVSINPATRTVVLENDVGEYQTFHIAPEVGDLNTIGVGDVIQLDYVEPIAISIFKSDDPVLEPKIRTVNITPVGSQDSVCPGGKVVKEKKAIVTGTRTVQVHVVDIEPRERLIRVAWDDGQMMTLSLAPDVDVSTLQPDDDVIVRFTQAVLVKVDKSQK